MFSKDKNSESDYKFFFKASFERSFESEFQQALLEGGKKRWLPCVIKNNNGQVIFCLSDPVDCINANKAEVYAMFMGCRELWKIVARNAIIEGDSFLAIQWGSGK